MHTTHIHIHTGLLRCLISNFIIPCLDVICMQFFSQGFYTVTGFNSFMKWFMETLKTDEQRHEKTNVMHMRNQRRRSASRYYREADQRLCFRYTDSTIPLLPTSEISSLYPSSVAVQTALCQTRSDTPKTGFLTTRLKWFMETLKTGVFVMSPEYSFKAYHF